MVIVATKYLEIKNATTKRSQPGGRKLTQGSNSHTWHGLAEYLCLQHALSRGELL